MYLKKLQKTLLFLSLLMPLIVLLSNLVLLGLPNEVKGGIVKFDYEPKTPLPGGTPSDLPGYIRALCVFLLGLSAIAVLASLTIGGILYMTAETITNKEQAMEYIRNALIGLLLALSAYLILYVINPDLVRLTEPINESVFD